MASSEKDQDMPTEANILSRVSPMSVNEKTKECESQESEACDTSCPATTSPTPDHDCNKQKDGPSCADSGCSVEIDRVAEDEKTEEKTPTKTVTFKVVFKKQKHQITLPLDSTTAELKSHLEKLTGVPTSMQKIMFKGRMPDDATLREQKVMSDSKIMLVGSTVTDVMSVTAPDPKVLKEEEKAATASGNKEPVSRLKPHKTVLDKYGKPDDAMIGIKNVKEPLPPVPLSGMYNKHGGKVRLTFKLEQDQLWIGTKERTEKVSMGSIKAVVSEPLDDNEEYHLMALQLGPTEASRYWIYWVPAQYVDSIKDAILGNWQFF